MFIILLSYTQTLDEVDKHIKSHITYLEKYYSSNKFIVSGRKVPRTGGVILANCANLQEVNNIIEEDPFFIAKVANYEIIEIIPTMTASGFDVFKTFV